MAETILRDLELLWDKLRGLLSRAGETSRILHEWSAGTATLADKATLIALAVLLVVAVAWLVGFFKAGFWKKIGMLLSAAVVIVAAAVVVSLVSAPVEEESGAPTPPALSAAPVEGGELPAAETPVPAAGFLPQGERQYSMVRGAADPFFPAVYSLWRLQNDEVSWQIGDDLAMQLIGIHSMPGDGTFEVEAMRHIDDMALITLKRMEGGGGAEGRWFYDSNLEIRVWPGAKISRMPWYGNVGSWINTGERDAYTILENTGSEVIFLYRDESQVNENDDALIGISIGRQLGSDVVSITARVHAGHDEDGQIIYTDLNPGADEELKERCLKLIRATYDRHFRLLRGLSEAGFASLLPDRIVDVPINGASGRGGFTIPCTRLVDFGPDDDWGGAIRLIGPGPDGRQCRYLLIDGGEMYTKVRMDRYFTWRDAYEKGVNEPDEEMTAFLGCPAVECDGGWVLDPGDFYSVERSGTLENYYFLSIEPLEPPATPEPTEEPAETTAPTDESEAQAQEGEAENG